MVQKESEFHEDINLCLKTSGLYMDMITSTELAYLFIAIHERIIINSQHICTEYEFVIPTVSFDSSKDVEMLLACLMHGSWWYCKVEMDSNFYA